MTVQIASVTFDCTDALAVGSFWSAALGRPLDPGASGEYAAIGFAGRRDRAGWAPVDGEHHPTWLFVRVPEGKVAKNRVHLDVMTPDVESEVGRLVGLGGTKVADKEEYGYTWTVMTDVEGNEFCVATAT
jgi:hypothetical protein